MDKCPLSPTSDPFNPFFSPSEAPHVSCHYNCFDTASSTSEWYPDSAFLQPAPKRFSPQRFKSGVDGGCSGNQDCQRSLSTEIKLGDSPHKARSLSLVAILPNYKTEFCNKFQKAGYCPFGDRCQFVHEFYELKKRGRALTYKTRMCWSGDSCRYQQNHGRCIYLHGDETAEMFDQQRGISFARVQKILMNKEHRQQKEPRQDKDGKKKRQDQSHQRHHLTESPGTKVPSRPISTESSSLLNRTVNRSPTLSNKSYWTSSWSSESSILCEQHMDFHDSFDDLIDTLVEPMTTSPSHPQTDQDPSFLPSLPDMMYPSMAYPLPHLASHRTYSMPDVICKFSLFDTSPLVPNIVPGNSGAHNGHGGTGSRSISHLTTNLPMSVPHLDHHPPLDFLSPGTMSDNDLLYMAHGRLHKWQDSCFESEESFYSSGVFGPRQDLLSSADPDSPLAPKSLLGEIEDRAIASQQNACKALEDLPASIDTFRQSRKSAGNQLLGLLARQDGYGSWPNCIVGRPVKSVTISLSCGSPTSGMGITSPGMPGGLVHYKHW